jgi:hypothetical protein
VDPQGLPVRNGTILFKLGTTGGVSPSGGSGQPYFDPPLITLDANGSFTVSLFSNTSITPGGTTYSATICHHAISGSQCVVVTGLTVSGATQNLSATLNAVIPNQFSSFGLPFPSSPRMVYSAFLPGALTSTWTGATLTLDKAITVIRVQVRLKTAPATCSPNAVVRLSDGTINQDVTLSAAANDSGAISVNFAAAAVLTIAVQTAAAGCGTSPADANVIVQYKMQ